MYSFYSAVFFSKTHNPIALEFGMVKFLQNSLQIRILLETWQIAQEFM